MNPPTQDENPIELARDKPEFLLAVILALMNKTASTHVTVTSADVMAATATQGLRFKSDDPTRMEIYLVAQPGEEHVGLDYAEPYIASDIKKRLQ